MDSTEVDSESPSSRIIKLLIIVTFLLSSNFFITRLFFIVNFFQKFFYTPDTTQAILSVSKLWNVSPLTLIALEDDFIRDSKLVAITNPYTLSSAMVWIPARNFEHTHTAEETILPGNIDIHLLSQYTPTTVVQRIIAFNFFGDIFNLIDKSAIMDIQGNAISGEIVVKSTFYNELRYPYFFTMPIGLLAIHVDR